MLPQRHPGFPQLIPQRQPHSMLHVAKPRFHGAVEQRAVKQEVDVFAVGRLHAFGHPFLGIHARGLQAQRLDVVEHRPHVLHHLMTDVEGFCLTLRAGI